MAKNDLRWDVICQIIADYLNEEGYWLEDIAEELGLSMIQIRAALYQSDDYKLKDAVKKKEETNPNKKRKRQRKEDDAIHMDRTDDSYKGWKSNIYTKYGITAREYERMFIAQDGKCAGCGTPQAELKTRLAVDHSHSAEEKGEGSVRSLVCSSCNSAIGALKDDPVIAMRIAEILINPFSKQVGVQNAHSGWSKGELEKRRIELEKKLPPIR